MRLGAFSYSLYLVHLPMVLKMTRWTGAHFSPLKGYLVMLVVGLPIILAAAYLFYWVFERPFTTEDRSVPKNMKGAIKSDGSLPLGFGCSSLMGLPDTRARTALLETAFESGIRHFDVARFYGFGEAEAALGRFLKTHRSEITVTTKFGIHPPAQMSLLKSVRDAARRLAASSPLLRRGMQSSAAKMVKRGNFSAEEARKSLEISLRELGTDYVDFYLLHDCRADDARSEDLLAFLQQSVAAGRVRRFGVSGSIADISEICRNEPAFASVVQFENSALRQNRPRLPNAPERLAITHRALSESLETLHRFFATNAEAAKRWSVTLDADCTSRTILGQLMLNYAVQSNPGGLVLFSSRSLKHIEENAQAVATSPFSSKQIALFASIAQEPGLLSEA